MEGIQEPLWGQWYFGECLYSSGPTQIYALTQRDGIGRPSVVKCIRIPAGQIEELKRVQAQCRTQERMADSGYAVAILNEMVISVAHPDESLSHYQVLLRMERLDCLAELLREGARLSESEVQQLACNLCNALMFANRLGIVHRDIKPANIYRSPSGQYKLGDFGIAEETHAVQIGNTAGTAAYLAPEVAKGKPANAQADIYALGIVLYQLLNHNHLPMTQNSSTYSEIQESISARLQGASIPRVPCQSVQLRQVVMKACQPDPKRRWKSAEEMLAALNTERKRPPLFIISACLLSLGLGFFAGWISKPSTDLPFFTQMPDAPFTILERTETTSDGETALVIHRYEAIQQALTWDEARIWCESRGGHLATITSAEEAEEVSALLDEAGLQAAWLGASNLNPAKGFQWVTDAPFSYAEWGIGEPNNTNGKENYLMLQYLEEQGWVWNDSRQDGMNNFNQDAVGFVCEWEEISP